MTATQEIFVYINICLKLSTRLKIILITLLHLIPPVFVTGGYFSNYKSDHLKVFVLSQTYIEEEMIRAGISLLPYLIVGFFIMCACSVVSVMVRAAYMHQSNIYKVLFFI